MVIKRRNTLTFAASALLLIPALASQAVTFTLTVPNSSTDPGSFIGGVSSDTGLFNTTLTPSGQTNILNASTVSYGITQIGTGGVGSDTFTSIPATFNFNVAANGVTNVFTVNGVINGNASVDANGNGSSTAAFQASSIVVNGTTFTTLATIPNASGRTGVEATNIQFGSTFANIYVEQFNALTPPNSGTLLSVGGFVGVVPEPGSLALLAGFGIGSASLLARRKRARKA